MQKVEEKSEDEFTNQECEKTLKKQQKENEPVIEEEVIVTASRKSCNTFSFIPTQTRWRSNHSNSLSLSKPRRIEKRRKQTSLGCPIQDHNIEGMEIASSEP